MFSLLLKDFIFDFYSVSLIDRSASEISWSRRDSSSSFGELNFLSEDVDPVLPEDTLLPPEAVPFAAEGELSCNLSGVWDFDLAAVAAFFSVSCKRGGSAKSFSSLGFLSLSLFLVLPGMIMKSLTTDII